ncbi:unnamed protein product [Allacma fusca]|nr:unnamed protein product [Allacma fusca]
MEQPSRSPKLLLRQSPEKIINCAKKDNMPENWLTSESICGLRTRGPALEFLMRLHLLSKSIGNEEFYHQRSYTWQKIISTLLCEIFSYGKSDPVYSVV